MGQNVDQVGLREARDLQPNPRGGGHPCFPVGQPAGHLATLSLSKTTVPIAVGAMGSRLRPVRRLDCALDASADTREDSARGPGLGPAPLSPKNPHVSQGAGGRLFAK